MRDHVGRRDAGRAQRLWSGGHGAAAAREAVVRAGEVPAATVMVVVMVEVVMVAARTAAVTGAA